MSLVVTGQVPQLLASLFEKEAEQTLKICNGNLMQMEAHLTPSKVVANPQKDVGFKLDASLWSFPKAKPGHVLALAAIPSTVPSPTHCTVKEFNWEFCTTKDRVLKTSSDKRSSMRCLHPLMLHLGLEMLI